MPEIKNLMREGTEDTYQIKELQNAILNIAAYIHEFCQEHEIEYCLMGGSALGAKRHGGFIPWDDDLDIFMTSENYSRFRREFRIHGDKSRFYLQEQGAIDGMVRKPKLRMNHTAYLEDGIENLKMHHGIFVDIFLLHNCPKQQLLRLRQCAWAKYIVLKSLSNQRYRKRNGIIQWILRFLRLFPKDFLLKKAYRELYRYDQKETELCCNFIGKAVYQAGIYEKAELLPAREAAFETIRLMVPGSLERFLETRYGDYRKIPSPEEIQFQQHAAQWSAVRNYTEYVNPEEDFSDESMLI